MDDNPPASSPEQPSTQPEQPSTQPAPARKSRKRIIFLILAIIAIAIVEVFLNYHFTLPILFQNNPFQQNFNETIGMTTTTSTENIATTTSTEIIIPTGISSAADALAACNNNCKELGYVYGNCSLSYQNNFTCTSSANYTAKKIDLPSSRNWCSYFSVNLTNGQTSECCCYR